MPKSKRERERKNSEEGNARDLFHLKTARGFGEGAHGTGGFWSRLPPEAVCWPWPGVLSPGPGSGGDAPWRPDLGIWAAECLGKGQVVTSTSMFHGKQTRGPGIVFKREEHVSSPRS